MSKQEQNARRLGHLAAKAKHRSRQKTEQHPHHRDRIHSGMDALLYTLVALCLVACTNRPRSTAPISLLIKQGRRPIGRWAGNKDAACNGSCSVPVGRGYQGAMMAHEQQWLRQSKGRRPPPSPPLPRRPLSRYEQCVQASTAIIVWAAAFFFWLDGFGQAERTAEKEEDAGTSGCPMSTRRRNA